ncbi:MAG: universal stress protein [Chloroflexi bacterium]|nr:universal stress protein [Chloroflexota bacterium]MBU1747303.1 universal stress protein [Chloroflexota bacterium]MBU1877328.1 universal stress protein [Chloroflexota bacterium]
MILQPWPALRDFQAARRRAALEAIMARLTGKSTDLLSYEDVRQKLHARECAAKTLQDIPLDAIVGSVGRYNDFTRNFLPRQDSDQDRWTRVQTAMTDSAGVPPIEVYQIGEAYFVLDGNHRVSVARRLDTSHIQAYVTPVYSPVPLTPDVQPDDLIIKAEYADFLAHTHLHALRPLTDLSVTVPGQYQALLEHIEVHRHFMGLEQQREIPYGEAVAHWYDTVYQPVVQIIREQGLLRDFPGRTEADLYLWLADHRADLAQELGWEVQPQAAAADLTARFSSRPGHVASRAGRWLRRTILPEELEAGPPTGQWREDWLTHRPQDRLFADVLVAINGQEAGWLALDQALHLARRDGSQLHGLHVVPSAAEQDAPAAQGIQAEFDRRCAQAGVAGRLALEVGDVAHAVCQRARWVDLIVLSLNYPPPPQRMGRLGSGLSTLIRRCPRPILSVPAVSPLDRALLAYDGSPKSDEALFVAAYLAGQWRISLVVVTALDSRPAADALHQAKEYLSMRDVPATFTERAGPADETVLAVAQEHACDLLIMGGYGHSPMVEVMRGSVVDEVMRVSQQPLLICR